MKIVKNGILIDENPIKYYVYEESNILADMLIPGYIYDSDDMSYIINQFGIINQDAKMLVSNYTDFYLTSIKTNEGDISSTKYTFTTYVRKSAEYKTYKCKLDLIIYDDLAKNAAETTLEFVEISDEPTSSSSEDSGDDFYWNGHSKVKNKNKLLDSKFGFAAKDLFYNLKKLWTIDEFYRRCKLLNTLSDELLDKYSNLYLKLLSGYSLKIIAINESYITINPVNKNTLLEPIRFPIK
jgi:hypothetical protein